MNLYLEESGIDLLKKAELILKAILDEKELDEIYKKRIKKKVAINLQIAIKHLELYITKCKLIVKGNEEIQANIDRAESIIKLLEASLGTDNSERFEKYYNTASNLLSDLKDLEEEQAEEEQEAEEDEEQDGTPDEKWFEEEGIENEKETNETYKERGREELEEF